MGMIKFEIKDIHLSLFKYIDLKNYYKFILKFDDEIIFDNDDKDLVELINEFGLVIYGKEGGFMNYNEEQIENIKEHIKDFEKVIQIFQCNSNIETGNYVTRTFNIDWIKK
jgi:hypothetical protein